MAIAIRDLPMPGSPANSATWPRPFLASCQSSRSTSSSTIAADKRRGPHSVQRLEAAFGTVLANDPPRLHRLGETLEVMSAEIDQLEEVRQAASVVGSATTTVPTSASA